MYKSFFLMEQVPSNRLEQGIVYRIVHIRGLRPTYIGKFECIYLNDHRGDRIPSASFYLKFNNIFPTSAFRIDEWTFHKSGIMCAINTACIEMRGDPATGSGESLPQDLERIVQKFVIGK